MDTTLPPVFDANRESDPKLGKVKASVAKKFSWTKQEPLFDTLRLASLLVVYGKEAEAIEVCRTMGRLEFKGTFHLWSSVQRALALQARLCRQRGEHEEADECLRRVREAGFVETRLEGTLLDPNGGLEEALKEKNKRREQTARLSRAAELAFIIELGGSEVLPVAAAEADWEQNMTALKQLAGVA